MVLRFSLLAVVFLLSCTEFERDNPYDEKGINYGNGNGDDNGDGWCGENVEELEFKFTDPRDKKVYKAIEFIVRKQCYNKDGYYVKTDDDSVYRDITWMAQNLNWNAPGSVCYDKNEANCETYGRLYDFETAKTACPPGWRLPISGEENNVFYNEPAHYLEKTFGYESCYKNAPFQRPNGDTYNEYCVGRWIVGLGGFFEYSSEKFSDLDSTGYWWTSTEGKAGYAYSLHGKPIKDTYGYYTDGSESYDAEIKKSLDEKSNLLSIRCVQD